MVAPCLVLNVALLYASHAWGFQDKSASTFLHRAAASHIAEPGAVNGQFEFERSIVNTPGDVLALFYSPNCPDCEWLMEKVWKRVAAKLDADSGITLMTFSDPGFDAPKPFEHWHNPAIFFAGGDNKKRPIFFPQERLQEYLHGLPTQVRPQETQDADFVQDVLVFAKGAMGVSVSHMQTSAVASRSLQDVSALADTEWQVLQRKWAGLPPAPAQPPRPVARPSPVVASPSDPLGFLGQALPTLMPLQEALSMNSKEPFPIAFGTAASLVTADRSVQQKTIRVQAGKQKAIPDKTEMPRKFAMDYAENFVQSHPGKGYTVDGVFRYALPYYLGGQPGAAR